MPAVKPLISEQPRDGLVLRFVDPDIAEFIEALPEYGTATLTLAQGRPNNGFDIARRVLFSSRRQRERADG